MTGKTTIEWTWMPGYRGAVWNPTVGCTRVSAGCDNCYAFAWHDKRYAANLSAAYEIATSDGYDGPRDSALIGRVRERVPKMLPFPRQYDLPFSRVQMLPDRLDVPLRTRKPTCYFVDSMADLFHEDVLDDYLDRVFDTMELVACTIHRFLILTKRLERMREYLMRRWGPRPDCETYARGERIYKPEHIWLGTSVEDQQAADERIPHLLATPAAVRFLSCEPLIGPVRIHDWIAAPGEALVLCPGCKQQRWVGPGTCALCGAPPPASIDWVIIGGESGPRARPMDLAWARSLVQQCRAAGVPVFVKQLGSRPEEDRAMVPFVSEPHGRDPDEWPEDLRVREWPR